MLMSGLVAEVVVVMEDVVDDPGAVTDPLMPMIPFTFPDGWAAEGETQSMAMEEEEEV